MYKLLFTEKNANVWLREEILLNHEFSEWLVRKDLLIDRRGIGVLRSPDPHTQMPIEPMMPIEP